MHYTFPQCRRFLTPGQGLRMECVLRQWRPSMVTANTVGALPGTPSRRARGATCGAGFMRCGGGSAASLRFSPAVAGHARAPT
ncbi:MAG: hypothetical protein AAF420_00180, partial [Pseudomonadota bacterium]